MGGATYLASLVDAVPSSANVGFYARIVREKSVLRRLIEGASAIAERGYRDRGSGPIRRRGRKIIFDIAREGEQTGLCQRQREVSHPGTSKAIEQLYERKELITGVPTGFKEVDGLTTRFRNPTSS